MSSEPARLFSGMIDLHGHLLPGIDDGAKTMEQALSMARIAVRSGIAVSLLTPHHLNGVYENPAEKVRQETKRFRAELAREKIELDVLPGAECHLVPELPRALADGKAMTVADRGKAVLVELPVHSIPMGATAILEDIMVLDLVPVIVHPERNSALRRHPERLAEWIDMGCLAQVTAQSCTGAFGPDVEQAARHMVTQGLIHFVASDAHRDRRRIPEIGPGREAINRWTSPEVGRLLSEEFPRALVSGRNPDTARLDDAIDHCMAHRSIWTRLRRSFGAFSSTRE